MGVPDLRKGETLRCMAKVRYHHSPQEAVMEAIGPDQVMVSFKEPVRAPAPGQSAVFYDDNDCYRRVVCGDTGNCPPFKKEVNQCMM